MDRTKRDIPLLEHIAKYCGEIADEHKYFGGNYEKFQSDKPYFKSVAMDLLQIGELANHLSKELIKKYNKVVWEKIIGLRNIIVHGYGSLQFKKIWDTSHEDATELQKYYLKIISENETPRRKQRGIVSGITLFFSPQAAGNLPLEIKKS